MKNMISRIFTIAAVLMILGAPSHFSQSATLLKATIPFEFKVLDQTLPAGDYTVRSARTENKSMLWIKNQDHSHVINVITMGAKEKKMQDTPYLVFHKYGDQHFLEQVWTADDNTGRQLVKSRAEEEVARNSTGVQTNHPTAPKSIVIAAR